MNLAGLHHGEWHYGLPLNWRATLDKYVSLDISICMLLTLWLFKIVLTAICHVVSSFLLTMLSYPAHWLQSFTHLQCLPTMTN